MAALETAMRIDVYHHVAILDDIAQAVMTGLQPVLQSIEQQGQATMAELDELKTAIGELKDNDQKAIMLIQQLVAKVEANKNDPAAIQALVDDVRLEAQALASAITAAGSQDQQPAPAPEPAPTPMPEQPPADQQPQTDQPPPA